MPADTDSWAAQNTRSYPVRVSSVEPTFAEALDAIYRERYTGPVTLHFIHGVPTVVEKPNPTQIRLRRT